MNAQCPKLLPPLSGVGVLVSLLAVSLAAQAQDAAALRPADKFTDPAFETYLDIGQLAPAMDMLDSGLLCDLAFQLAEGERVLQREHKAGSYQTVAELALLVATENRDHQTLDRLAKLAEKMGNAELVAQIKLTRVSRKQDAVPQLDKLDDASRARYVEYRRQAVDAKIRGDIATIRQLKKYNLESPDPLPKELRDRVTQELDEALKLGAVSRSGEETDKLDKLLHASRQPRWLGAKQVNTGPHQTLLANFKTHRNGAEVVDFVTGSPLRRKGMKQGDVIYEIDGEVVKAVRDMDEHGGFTEIKYRRGPKKYTITVNLKDWDFSIANNSGGNSGGGSSGGGSSRPRPTFKPCYIWFDDGAGDEKWWGPYDRGDMVDMVNDGTVTKDTPVSVDTRPGLKKKWDLAKDFPPVNRLF